MREGERGGGAGHRGRKREGRIERYGGWVGRGRVAYTSRQPTVVVVPRPGVK